jgi:hypothetical protein
VDRRSDPTQHQFISEWRRSSGEISDALATTDGRWAMVSTSLTAIVAGIIAWLAIGTMPPSGSLAPAKHRNPLMPYQLFQQLAHASRDSYAALGPTPGSIQQIDASGVRRSLDGALAAERGGDNANPSPGVETRTITLDRGDTLAGALTDAGASKEDANAVSTALARVFQMRSFRAGQTLDLTFQTNDQTQGAQITPEAVDNISLSGDSQDQNFDSSGVFVEAQAPNGGRLLTVAFSPSVEHDVTVTRSADGTFNATDEVAQLEAHVHRAGATIDSSLYLAAMQAGIPADVVVEMIHMFSYKVDFQRDIKPGDSFEVFYDYY